MKPLLLVPVLLTVIPVLGAAAAGSAPRDRTSSPYFFVKSDDPAVDQLPLKSSAASVDIAGVIARVTVTQVYRNEGKRPIEAIYVFPGSTRAAVHGMKMTIADRVITARIQEREEARRQYNTARQAGQTASLLEQQRPNVFQMSVANVLPGDEIRVELVYTEMLVPEGGVYEFVYPTVVGPRYTRGGTEAGDGAKTWTANPYLHQGEPPTMAVHFDARIVAGMPLKEVVCPSHDARIAFQAPSRATVALDPHDNSVGNRDVVLRYRLADNRIETGLLLGGGGDEQFFVCLVEPPARFTPAAIPPREYIFIMDVSGSMNGFPIATSQELFRNLLSKLRPSDYFNVLFFSGGSYVLSPASLQATEANKTFALHEIEQQQGGGGTELVPALEHAFGLARAQSDISRVIAIVTDGYVDVERQAFTLIRQHLGDANVFAFGIGRSVNRHLIEGMARVGEGLPFVVLDQAEAQSTASRFLRYIESPLLTHIEVSTPGFDVYDLEPARIPDVFAERPLVLVGKYRGRAAGTIVVRGRTGQGVFERRVEVDRDAAAAGNDALKYLWARERVALLSDFASVTGLGAGEKQQIVALGLKYSLLTEFTSFVAVDQRKRSDGQLETVKQPLPLPDGVSDLAVGDRMTVAEVAAFGGGPRTMAKAPVGSSALHVVPLPSMAQRTAATEPPARQDVRGLQLTIVENRVRGNAPISDGALQSALRSPLANIISCAGGRPQAVPIRLKIFFDKGRAIRTVVLDAQKSKLSADLVACLQAAARNVAMLPSHAAGYVVVTVAW